MRFLAVVIGISLVASACSTEASLSGASKSTKEPSDDDSKPAAPSEPVVEVQEATKDLDAKVEEPDVERHTEEVPVASSQPPIASTPPPKPRVLCKVNIQFPLDNSIRPEEDSVMIFDRDFGKTKLSDFRTLRFVEVYSYTGNYPAGSMTISFRGHTIYQKATPPGREALDIDLMPLLSGEQWDSASSMFRCTSGYCVPYVARFLLTYVTTDCWGDVIGPAS